MRLRDTIAADHSSEKTRIVRGASGKWMLILPGRSCAGVPIFDTWEAAYSQATMFDDMFCNHPRRVGWPALDRPRPTSRG